MRFPSMLRRLRNTQGGMRSTARSGSGPYYEPPVAEAGSNQTVLVNETVSFSGSGSTGTNLRYSWAFGTGATPATGSGVMPSCTYSTPGTKVVTLTVTDNAGATASDTVTINVHSAPICLAGSNQTVSVGETVRFDGSGSYDPDGGNLIYSWAFGTDATPSTGSGVMPSCTYSTTGTKTVTLTVTDAAGATASDTVTITVEPVADAGNNQTVLVGETVNFDGSGSEGSNLSYAWAFGAGATPATGTGSMPSCSYSTIGTKTVTLTVTANGGVSRSDTVTITVHSAPVADAGSDQDVSVNKTVSFDGSGSSDPDGGELSYSWAFGTDATPSTGSGVMPSCTYSTTGAKTVTLTVTDDEGVSRSDTVTITVHSLPVADAGSSQGASVGRAVSFDGSGSTGSNLSYSWDFGAYATPATGSGVMPSCTYSRPGDKIVTLTVTDVAGATARDTATVYAFTWPAPPPDAEAGDDQTVLVGETVRFDGSGSTGNNLTYSWDFGTDATPSTGRGATPTCTYSTTGEKTVTLTVTDVTGSERPQDSDEVTITVHDAPIADAGSDQTVLVGETVSFDGSGSSDPDGGNLTYSWEFGADADPETAEGVMPFCIYSARGAKTVILTVTDDEGATASDTVTINVYNPPVADAGNNQTVAVGTEVSFDGSGSSDPDGGVLTYSWEFGDAEDPTAIGSEVTASHTYSTIGDKTVTLTVTDDEGATASHTVIITVFKVDAGDAQRVFVGKRVNFTGTIENAPAGVTYSWDFGHDATDAEDDDGLTPSCTYTMGGSKTVELTVSYTVGGEVVEASDTVTITVIEVGVALSGMPRVVAVGGNGTRVSFEGTVSNAPADATFTYSWNFGGNTIFPKTYGSTASCIYTMPGVKTVKLTVDVTIDGQEVQVEGTCVIEVFKVDAGSPQIVGVNRPVSFNGIVTGAPADATPTYSWDFGEGAMPATGSTLRASCRYTTDGDKTAELTVSFTGTDGESVERSDTVKITVPQLRVHGPRRLSPLEIDAVRLVFGDSESFTDEKIRDKIRIQLVWEFDGQPSWRGSENDGLIKIAIRKHPYTDFLNHSSTRSTVDIFKPGNMEYLNTFIHECTHWWQDDNDRYDFTIPGGVERYNFDYDTLRDLTFRDKEAHASAAGTWFVIGWQLEYRDVEVEPMINLNHTNVVAKYHVGTVDRYQEIQSLPNTVNDKNDRYYGRWVPRESEEDLSAEDLSSHFSVLLDELRSH